MRYVREINGLEVTAEYSDQSLKEIFFPLLKGLSAIQRRKNQRIIVLLAAPPAAGKSTLVSFLQYLSEQTEGMTPITAVGMDGFHHNQEYLNTHTVIREGKEIPMAKVKGAPVSFDLGALSKRICQIYEKEVCPWPEYDRKIHNPVDNAVQIRGDIVLIEGNYLLLDQTGWRELRSYADYTIRILAEAEDVRDRLIWRKAKGCGSVEAAKQHVENSDIPNVRLCMEQSLEADLTLRLNSEGNYVYVRGRLPDA